jgi:hypothetical protein
LGHDALGLVWAGTDLLLRRDVLVREVMAGDQLPPEERASFQRQVAREARAVSRINHPGIVTLLNVVEEPGRTFVITERGEGRTLDRVVEEDGPLHPSDVASIGRHLLSALTAAHRKGIVHRDVRPGTVLVLDDGRAKLTDFAIVASVGGASDPAFTPPDEVGADDGGAEADFWGLGGTLFFAVEGEPPYGPRGPGPDWIDQPLRTFGAGLLAPILQALLSGNPEDRGALDEMQDRLEAIEWDGAEDVDPPHPARRTAPQNDGLGFLLTDPARPPRPAARAAAEPVADEPGMDEPGVEEADERAQPARFILRPQGPPTIEMSRVQVDQAAAEREAPGQAEGAPAEAEAEAEAEADSLLAEPELDWEAAEWEETDSQLDWEAAEREAAEAEGATSTAPALDEPAEPEPVAVVEPEIESAPAEAEPTEAEAEAAPAEIDEVQPPEPEPEPGPEPAEAEDEPDEPEAEADTPAPPSEADEAEPAGAEPGPEPKLAEPAEAETAAEPEPELAEAELAEAETEPTAAETEVEPTEPEPAGAEPEPEPAAAEVEPTEPEPATPEPATPTEAETAAEPEPFERACSKAGRRRQFLEPGAAAKILVGLALSQVSR